MLKTIRGIGELRRHWASEERRELLAVLLDACSPAEANLALGLLVERMTPRALIAAVNLREVLATLPAYPRIMAVDVATLAEIAGYRKDRACYVRPFDDPRGAYEVVFMGDGNLCYDVLLTAEGSSAYWTPARMEEDFVTPAALALVLERETLLAAVVDLAMSMGVVYSPRFYMSLDDWRLEYAEDAIDDLGSLF